MRRVFGKIRYHPAGEWVQTSTLFEVAGISYRKSQALHWAQEVERVEKAGLNYGLAVKPEATNQNDQNALMIFGNVQDQENSLHIGYVPREIAADLADYISSHDIPVAAELYDITIVSESQMDLVYVRAILLAPTGHGLKKRLEHAALLRGEPSALAEQAKQRGDTSRLEALLADMCANEVKQNPNGVAPRPFVELAKLFRKQKRLSEEMELLEYWDKLPKPRGNQVDVLSTRLEKLR
jgi:HIRAN domain